MKLDIELLEETNQETLDQISKAIADGDKEMDPDSAIAIYEKILHQHSDEFKFNHAQLFAQCYMRISWEYKRLWDLCRKDTACKSYLVFTQKALEFYENNQIDNRECANCYKELNKAFNCNSMISNNYLGKAHKIYEKIGMETSCDMADCLVNIGLAYNLASNVSKADSDFVGAEFDYLTRAKKIYLTQSENRLKAYFLLRLGIVYGRKNDLKNELRHVIEAYKMYEDLNLGTIPEAIYCLIVAAMNCNIKGDHMQEKNYLEKIYKVYHELKWFDVTQQAHLLTNLAQACSLNNNHKQELEYLKEASVLYESCVGLVHQKYVADCLVRLGIAYNANNNHYEELKYLKKGYKIYTALKADTLQDHLEIAECLKCLGTAYGNNNKHDKELEYQLKAYKIYHSLNLGENKELADCLKRLAIAHDYHKNFDAEIDCLQRAESMYESLDLTSVRDYGICLMRLGIAYNNVKQYHLALSYHYKAREVLKKLNPEGSKELMAEFWLSLGVVYNNNELHKEALQYKRKAYQYYSALGDSIEAANYFKSLGQSYGLNSDNINELEFLKRAYKMFKKLGLDQDPDMIACLKSLAVAYFNNSNNSMFVKYSKKANRMEKP